MDVQTDTVDAFLYECLVPFMDDESGASHASLIADRSPLGDKLRYYTGIKQPLNFFVKPYGLGIMSHHTKNNQSGGNKIATYIGRTVICLFGVGLLVLFVVSKLWKSANFGVWITFGAIIGLFLGYGLGGDIWGARLFDLFTLQNSRRLVQKDGEPRFIPAKTTLLILLGIFVLLVLAAVVATIGWRHFL